jgi:RNA polymerase sigma factor (sigma-70 family)
MRRPEIHSGICRMDDDRQLLSNYVSTASHEAFAELVRRNADMVYSSAFRQLGDEHLAQDVTQAVFFLLARKAKHVSRTVAGWLIWTTFYACRDARKLAVRRAYHERRAGSMRLAEQPEDTTTDWETYAPALDAALMRLSSGDRDAVVLRYFRAMSLRDVGQILGISEEAARKRVSRAIERLRALMSLSAAVPAAPILARQFAVHAVQPAPSSLVGSILSGSIAKGTLPAAIAAKTAAAMATAQVKIAAIVLLAIALAAGAGGSIFVLLQNNSSNPIPAPASAAIPAAPANPPPEIPETAVNGQIQLVQWEAILNDAGAAALNDVLTPLNTDSKVFRAVTANGAKLRALVNSLRLQGNTTNVPNLLAFATQQPDGSLLLHFSMATFMDNPNGETVNGRLDRQGRFTRTDDNHLHFDLKYRDIKMLSVVLTRGAETWSDVSTVSLVAVADLTAGDAIAFIADFHATNGKTYHRLFVWETFKATSDQMPFFQQRSVSWWCARGPAQLRTWADQTLLWQSKAKHPPDLVAPQYQKKLSDGKIVRLIAFNRGTDGPFCWWDPHGDPVVGPNDKIGLVGDPTDGVFAAVEVSGPPGEKSLADPLNNQNSPTNDEPFDQTYVLGVKEPTASLDAGVLVGPWIDCGDLPPNKKISVNATTFRVETKWHGSQVAFNARLTITGGRDFADYITAIPQDGDPVGPENFQSAQMAQIERATLPQSWTTFGVYRLSLDNVKTFHLYRRKREWVRFDNIALVPNQPPAQ